MKLSTHIRLIAASVAFLATAVQSYAIGFIDIPVENQVGTGANQSGLIIDFNDGATTDRYVFQYNWDGAADTVSGAEMLIDVAAAITDLSIFYAGTAADGFYMTQLSYATQSETNGDFSTNFDYWGYFVAGGSASGNSVSGAGETAPDSIDGSPVGAGELSYGSPGRFIADNSWDVWSFGPYETSYAVPEVSSYALLAGMLSLGFVLSRRRQS